MKAGSPELNRPPRSRLQAAYDVCPELREVVEAAEATVTQYPLIHNRRAEPAWIRNQRTALATIQSMEMEDG